jgi:hypothetical protein
MRSLAQLHCIAHHSVLTPPCTGSAPWSSCRRKRAPPCWRDVQRLTSRVARNSSLTRADRVIPNATEHSDPAPAVCFMQVKSPARTGIAVVGSRHLDDAGQGIALKSGMPADFRGRSCSWAVRGVDTSAPVCARPHGTAVSILADSLTRGSQKPKARWRGDLLPPWLNSRISVGAVGAIV